MEDDYEDIHQRLNDEDNSPLNDEFGDAYNNLNDFDPGFKEQRADAWFANFEVDPEEARQMQQEELDRIREAEGHVEDDEDYTEVEDDGYSY